MRELITNFMNSKPGKTVWLIYAIFSVCLVIYLGDGLLTIGYNDMSEITYMNDNWNIKINGDEYEGVSLEEFSFDTVTIGDTVEISNTFPEKWEYKDPVMVYHTRQAAIDMYVDNQLEYQYGHERVEQGKTVGSGLLFINMHDKYKGKDVKFVLTVTEDRAFSRLDEIWISEWNDSYRYVVTRNRVPMFLGFFFVVFGIVVVCIAAVAVLFSKKYVRMLWLSMFAICMGLWSLCYNNCVIVFSLPLYSISLMEYMALYIAPIPIIGFMKGNVKSTGYKLCMYIHRVLFFGQFILTSVLIVLHTMDIVHAAASLPYFHIALVIHMIFYSIILYMNMKKERKLKKTSPWSFVGPVLVLLFIGYDMIVYMVRRYVGNELPEIRGISTLGMMVFVIMLVIDIWYSITDKMMEEQEKDLLIRRVYTDDMTMMNNRRYCSEYMHKLAQECAEYSIISLDLNGLKETNDKYGHIKGDKLIKTAAEVISKAFSTAGIVGRMGGDEFISIIKTVDQDEIRMLIEDFNKEISETNKREDDLELSIALGFASSIEIENAENVEKVYHMADNRMYDNKKQIKKDRKSLR